MHALLLLLLACGDKDADDTALPGDGGADAGDSGGVRDGGGEDGGAEDGGAEDGGADGGAGDGGADGDADGDGWSVAEGDCDDAQPDVHPEAEELCRDGVDQDCDGAAGPCAWPALADLDSADLVLQGEATGSLWPFPVYVVGDTDGDGTTEWGALEDRETRLVDGWPGGGTTLASSAVATVSGADGLWPLVPAGDLDGDGLGDVWAGQPLVSGDTGAVHLLAGPLAGDVGLADARVSLAGPPSGKLGFALAGTGDLTGDGAVDLAAGAPDMRVDGEPGERGAVYLWAGPVAASGGVAEATARVLGEPTATWYGGDNAGEALATGDLDGDGVGDLVVGASGGSTTCACDPGRVYVLPGPLSGELSVREAAATITGVDAGDGVGLVVVVPGDEDGDGYDDLWLGAPYGANRAVRYAGPVTGSLTTADAVGRLADALAGSPFAVGDLDGDGQPDVGLGMLELPGTPAGSGGALLLFDPVTGTVDAASASVRIDGIEALDGASTLAAPGDLDGDGYGELLVGAVGVNAEPEVAGRIYLLRGYGL